MQKHPPWKAYENAFCGGRFLSLKKDYPAGVAAPASLLTHRVRGCNEFYHLR